MSTQTLDSKKSTTSGRKKGGALTGKNDKTSNTPSWCSPGHSNQMFVITDCMQRLTTERDELKEVQSSLKETLITWDQQIMTVEKMLAIARDAQMFQAGLIKSDAHVPYDWSANNPGESGNVGEGVNPEWLEKAKSPHAGEKTQQSNKNQRNTQ